ncbi:MAG: AAA family ATPase [Rhodospirillales bacterium]|nr:AAA family ATPase [Rhodospirillales bacterium]
MIVENQSEVVAFLSRPDTYAEAGIEPRPVERIDTHASVLFLVGDQVYKLKRAVRFPYLDYSTCERRRRFCEAEVEVNCRTAPDLYRGVIPIVRRSNGGLALGGEGEIVDWVVKLRRFDQEALFDRLAAAGRLDRFAMESLADAIARFHDSAERRPADGGADGVARVLDGNRTCFESADAAILDPAKARRLVDASQRAFVRLAPLLDHRRDEGFVRHCHGDLHLRNIVVHNGHAVLFDAIEFDPSFAAIDVLYDLAFLVMDLHFCGYPLLASIVLNRYLDNTGDGSGDVSGLAALPLFLSMRAAIRSHIEALAAASQSSAGQADERARSARRYLDLAFDVLAEPHPCLIAVGGLSGSGKSRLARELAPRLGPAPGARVVRTDSTRKRLAGVALGTRLGTHDYSEAMGRRTYEAVFDEARRALAAGCPVIADAVFARPEERAAIAEVARLAGVAFHGIWLNAASGLLEQRVAGRRNNVSDATPEVVRLQLAYDLGDIDWWRLDSSGDATQTLDAACAWLGM